MQVNRQRHTPLAIFHWIGQSVGPTADPASVQEGTPLPLPGMEPRFSYPQACSPLILPRYPGDSIKFSIRERKVYRK